MKGYLLASALLLLLPLSACNSVAVPSEAPVAHQQVFDTTVVHHEQFASPMVLPARVLAIPTDVVHVYPMVSGRVLSLRILPGQQVRRGEEIGSLQSSDAVQARSDYDKARIEAERADLQLSRAKLLLAHDVMAQRDYDDLKALDEADHADLQRTRQTLQILGFSPNSSSDVVPLLAPISGVVLDVGTGAGELQRSLDNATAIATIANINSIWVVGNLYPRDQPLAHVGQPATITISGYPGLTLHGKVANISDAVDPATLTLQVRVVLPNPGYRLKPDMFASMALSGQSRDVIPVPATAVIRNGADTFVFVETAQGKYQRRNVVLGETHADTDEVVSGLSDGERVVITGAELLRGSEDQ